MKEKSKIESERFVIGTLLNNPEVLPSLNVDYFISQEPKQILAAISILQNNRQEITPASVAKLANLDVEIIAKLYEYEDLHNLDTYIESLRKRKQQTLLEEVREGVAKSTSIHEVEEIVEIAKRKSLPVPSLGNVNYVLSNVIEEYYRKKEDPNILVPFPLRELNEQTGGGLQPGYSYYAAGRPRMGKSSFVDQIRETALKQRKVVVTFSLDMAKERLITRSAARNLGLDIRSINSGTLTEEDEEKYILFLSKLNNLEKYWYLFDTGDFYGYNPLDRMYDLLSSVYRNAGEISFFDLDYLQKVYVGINNRALEIAYICNRLTQYTRLFDCANFTQSQLNRDLESRLDKRPQLSDLRDSGATEQEGDVIIFIHREWVYSPNEADPREAEFILGKNRDGITPYTIYCDWDGERFSFIDRFV